MAIISGKSLARSVEDIFGTPVRSCLTFFGGLGFVSSSKSRSSSSGIGMDAAGEDRGGGETMTRRPETSSRLRVLIIWERPK